MNNLFEGLRVVDFTNNYAGPITTCYLADFGAEVIKIEKPGSGDDSRAFSPQLNGLGVPFMWVNRNKKSIVADMKDPEGKELVQELVKTADIVVESFKPGTMEKLGMGYEELKKINPSLIMCSISAFGQTGPYSRKPGYDIIAQALSGMMDASGDPNGEPTRIGFAIADYNAGVHGFAAIGAALYYRKCTGRGQYIDMALLDCLTSFNGFVETAGLGGRPTRTGNLHGLLTPFGVYQGSEGSIVIAAANQRLWEKLCHLMGKAELIDDPEIKTTADRVKNQDRVTRELETWLQTFDNVDGPLKILDEGGVPCCRVNTANDLLENPQLIARGMMTELETPDGVMPRKLKARGNPFVFSEVKPNWQKAPILGQDMDEVLKSIGFDEGVIASLKQKWKVS